MPTDDDSRKPPAEVAIFGAGIAGLTAAHELIERNFRVTVYEPTPPGPGQSVCSVGGLARTQWGCVPRTPSLLEKYNDSSKGAKVRIRSKRREMKETAEVGW